MVQTLTTLLFLLAAGTGMAIIAASLIDDWALMLQALGLGRADRSTPLPPQVRAIASRQMATVRFMRQPERWRAAA